ncbi:hypothetical protein ALC57_16549 [Trachymyrmex cornetzi]|uniref:Uncharacterized protein n=1 Tax=Trachymyrmex cornetzi TaxID=471704 RepID=A0A195DES3_9HYME|nr:hypothetical protein ALC57_16549 [Trachymyrmex cornetzi]
MKHKLRSGTLVFSLLMIIIIMRRAATAARGKNRNTNDGDNNDEDEREKRERDRSRALWSRSPNASQSRTNRKQRSSVWKRGREARWRGKGPEEEKRGVKRWTRGLKDSERLANPNEGTIAEVCKNEIYICKSAPNPQFPPLPKTIGAKSRNIKELAARLITFIRRGLTIKKGEKERTSIGRTERA